MGGRGSGGWNRKSNNLHVLQGTCRADRHASGTTLADLAAQGKLGNVGEPYRWLPAEGKRLWRDLRPELEKRGILCALDRPLYAILCQLWADFRQLSDKVATEGLTFTGPRGREYPNPRVAMLASAERELLSLAREYGLTPASRKRLGVPIGELEEEIDDKERLYFDFLERRPR